MADPTIERYSRLRELKCFDEVHEMLLAGFPTSAVAKFIQDDCQEYRDVKRMSLVDVIGRYRDTLRLDEMVSRTLPSVFVKAREKFSNRLEDLQRLDKLYNKMEYRLRVAHGEERLSGDIDPKVDKIVREQREIIRQMHAIRMELGLTGSRDLGTITVSAEKIEQVKEKYGEGAAKAFANPVSRNRVLAAMAAINRVGGLKDTDGNAYSVADAFAVSEAERTVIDAEFEVHGPEQVEATDIDGEDGAEDGEKKPVRRREPRVPAAARMAGGGEEDAVVEAVGETQEEPVKEPVAKRGEDDSALEEYLSRQRKKAPPPGPKRPGVKKRK